jgi:antitoxin (DNA-binding transcriptional repressor) of toxin-antitoxin stability system
MISGRLGQMGGDLLVSIQLHYRERQHLSSDNLLRKAKPVNVREAQTQLSKLIRSKSPSMVLSHGKPVLFLVPYEDMLDLVETLDELIDKKLLEEIERVRKDYAQGKAVPAERLFKKIEAKDTMMP